MKTWTILLTGSRGLEDYNLVARQLAIAFSNAKEAGYEKVIVRHGKCKTGADAFAAEFCNKVEEAIPGLIIEQDAMPAKWGPDRNPAAGPIRNKAMVDKGADECLAFIGDCTSARCPRTDKHPSHGASGCAKLAEQAKIPTKYFRG